MNAHMLNKAIQQKKWQKQVFQQLSVELLTEAALVLTS